MMSANTTRMFRGQLRLNEPLSRHTSWRVGGPADRFYVPDGSEDLVIFLRSLPPAEAVLFLGLGSNLLVRDGGFRGTVIATSGALNGLALVEPALIRAEAGVASAKLARFSMQHRLRGAEFLAGIPGTIGGALAMNAGAFGGETWSVVEAVDTVDRDGMVRTRPAADFKVAYRDVRGVEGEWFLAGYFRLTEGETGGGKSLIKSLLAKRGASQPTQLPNAGSVFRNPPGDHAARLIEAAQLKGCCEGAACVSELHANFIVNRGGATAAHIEALIERVADRVQAVHGIRLQREVHIVGERG